MGCGAGGARPAPTPHLVGSTDKTRAAVAVVLGPTPEGLQLLFIERAQHPDDPWSGHIAFPGGRIEADDPSPRAAAERETLEEVGLDLSNAEYWGRVDDLDRTHVAGGGLRFRLSLGDASGFDSQPRDRVGLLGGGRPIARSQISGLSTGCNVAAKSRYFQRSTCWDRTAQCCGG